MHVKLKDPGLWDEVAVHKALLPSRILSRIHTILAHNVASLTFFGVFPRRCSVHETMNCRPCVAVDERR